LGFQESEDNWFTISIKSLDSTGNRMLAEDGDTRVKTMNHLNEFGAFEFCVGELIQLIMLVSKLDCQDLSIIC
jgi:hypothetical protein